MRLTRTYSHIHLVRSRRGDPAPRRPVSVGMAGSRVTTPSSDTVMATAIASTAEHFQFGRHHRQKCDGDGVRRAVITLPMASTPS